MTTSTITSTITPDVIVETVQKIHSDWGTVGALASAIAVVKLLVDLTKTPLIDRLLADHTWKWVRPALAIVLGALTSLSAALAAGTNPVLAIVVGMIGGGGAVGLNQILGMFRDSRKALAVEVGAVLPPMPRAVVDKVEDAKAEDAALGKDPK